MAWGEKVKRMCTNVERQNQNPGFNEFSPFSQYGKLTLNYGTRSKNKKEINDMIFINSLDYIKPEVDSSVQYWVSFPISIKPYHLEN